MRANPKVLSGINRYWIRFFLLAVFATMFVRDHARPEFHKALGVDPTDYDREVFRICSEITKQVFPITLPLDDPRFIKSMHKLNEHANGIARAKKKGGLTGLLGRALHMGGSAVTFVRLYFLPMQENKAPAKVLLTPVW